jgi:hypothetical protein
VYTGTLVGVQPRGLIWVVVEVPDWVVEPTMFTRASYCYWYDSRAALIFRFSKCADRSRAYSNFICSEIPTGATNLLYI